MAFTYERKIDALGGVDNRQSDEWNDGYAEALREATEIGADADEMIAELMETIDKLVHPSPYSFTSLSRWADDAETLLRRIRARVA